MYIPKEVVNRLEGITKRPLTLEESGCLMTVAYLQSENIPVNMDTLRHHCSNDDSSLKSLLNKLIRLEVLVKELDDYKLNDELFVISRER